MASDTAATAGSATAPRVVAMDEVEGLAGEHLGYSSWWQIDQQRIDAFADATADHQWIHVDPERAAAGPFGSTIAHGYLTLSLVTPLLSEIVRFDGTDMVVNYGLDRLRFPAPVPVGARIRAGARLADVEDVRGGVQCRLEVTIEREDGDRPCCVAEVLFRLYGRTSSDDG